MANPYNSQSRTQFWKTAVGRVPPDAVMPIRAKRFNIETSDVIATAGSCFSQEVGKFLATMVGTTLLRAEEIGPDQPLFSALYGNVYTARQLIQLFDRAFDRFAPLDVAWQREDGRFVDPFRPYVFKEGFATKDQTIDARAVHLDAVRRVFTNSSIFIFTLGLTESWRAKSDGAVFPVAPGVVSDAIEPSQYEFHNFTYAEVLADLRDFLARLRTVNPKIRVILTVSPIPLTATFMPEHVLMASSHSKAILRAVCSEIDTNFDFVFYFPSYELIYNPFNKGMYYNDNLRTVTKAGVDHVMKLFRQTYFGATDDRLAEISALSPVLETSVDPVICDEEEIVRSIGFN